MRAESFRRAASEQRGFTLTELLAAIAILGILVAIAIVILLGVLEQRRVDAAAKQFASDLRLAHISASNQLTDWRIVFRPDGSPLEGCAGSGAVDYCLAKLESPYVTGSAYPTIAGFTPRYFPEGTKIRANFQLDCSAGDVNAAVPPSECGSTSTLEFNSNGTARTLRPGVSASVAITSTDGDPARRVSFRTPTSRVRVE